jgi:hypothetical protein
VRRVVRPVREAGVDDIELLLVGTEGDAVGLDEIVDDNLDVTGFRIAPATLFIDPYATTPTRDIASVASG